MADAKSSVPTVVPARQTLLDRQALERVLARAAELQGAGSLPDTTDLLSESQLLEIGTEVGLSRATLNQALAEERTRVTVPEEKGFVAQVAGAQLATATRTVAGTQTEVLAAIDTWMQREECLSVQRRFADRITWEPQRGVLGKIRKGFNLGGRGYHLMDASQVSGTVMPVDAERVVVRLDADVSSSRSRRIWTGGVLVVAGALASSVIGFGLVVAHVPLLIAAASGLLPFAGSTVAGYQIARSHRAVLSSVQLALEQVLDRLEHGEINRQTGLLDAIISRPRLPRL
jgi:hypothetical protein